MPLVTSGEPPDLSLKLAAFKAEAEKALYMSASLGLAEVKRRAPFRTGELRRRIAIGPVKWTQHRAIVTMGVDIPYARYQEEGTGLYGPKNQWIYPKNARVLRWPAGGGASLFSGGARMGGSAGPGFRLSGQQRSGAAGASAGWAFAKRVRGVRPRRYFRDGVLVSQGVVQASLRRALIAASERTFA